MCCLNAPTLRADLDTNGTRPQVLKALLDENLLDMVAMDYKAPRNKFRKVTRMRESLWDNFQKSLRMMVAGSVPFEVRTTVHTDLFNVADVAQMHADLEACGYRGSYHVQNYRHGPTLGDMARQDAVLQVAALPVGQKVRVEFRNF
ncbi:MAG: hypothetical protein JNN24_09415 [Hyphomicrobium zavarzinii]|uniref:hypothetical protein n=1 Tax=Hyphomicrobium zavarzinii TaxID=48292 RepID=UPI001A4427A1|nr:hypothetical protein [Hyphomicrobium zavarzinii]MBL8845972.1 hypothetical protein [Hyphomicrobium zavarzinii]